MWTGPRSRGALSSSLPSAFSPLPAYRSLYLNALIPVIAWPMISVWMSCVPSYV